MGIFNLNLHVFKPTNNIQLANQVNVAHSKALAYYDVNYVSNQVNWQTNDKAICLVLSDDTSRNMFCGFRFEIIDSINQIEQTPLVKGIWPADERLITRLEEFLSENGKYCEFCGLWKNPFIKVRNHDELLLLILNYGVEVAQFLRIGKIIGLTPLWMMEFWTKFGYAIDSKVDWDLPYGPDQYQSKLIILNDHKVKGKQRETTILPHTGIVNLRDYSIRIDVDI